MPRRKKRASSLSGQEKDPNSIEVKLKPILGISPRQYVPIIWLVIVLALVFFLLVLPGINRNGTWLTVYSDPPDASVIADGIRSGRTYEPVFIPKGTREIRIRRPGFVDEVIHQKNGGRIFASRLFPRRREMEVTLKAEVQYPQLPRGIEEFAAWTATGLERRRYAIPPALTILARDLSARDSGTPGLASFAGAALPMARDARHLTDINRALYLLSSSNAIANPFPLAKYLGKTAEFLDEYFLTAGVLEVAGRDSPMREAPPSVQKVRQVYQEVLESNGFSRNIYNGVPFVTIPALKAPIGDIEIAASGGVFPRFGAFPVEAAVDTFQIASQEVTTDEFAVFLRDMPYWSEANKDALIGAGFVDNNYLQSWSGSLPPAGRGDYPLTDVSWHAAMAYADWLTDQIFPDGGGRVRLPREDEWEIAARIDSGLGDALEIPGVIEAAAEAGGGEIGLLGMIGNVREWCYNPFRYNENRFRPPSGSPAYLDADSKLAGGERVVRGAAFIDADLPYPAAVRGSLKAHQTSPVVGFRVLIPSR